MGSRSFIESDEVEVLDTSNNKIRKGTVVRTYPGDKSRITVWLSDWKTHITFYSGVSNRGRFKLKGW